MKINNKQIVAYVKDMVIDNLRKRDFWQEIFIIINDKSGKVLVGHIDGLIELFTKAKEILERGKNDKD